MSMESKTEWVVYAKANGIMLVVYGHMARGLDKANIALPEAFYRLADSIIYSFHMPLFFFLSGLFFYASFNKYGSKQFVLNKVDTIVYPYLLWSLLQGTLEATLSSYTSANISFAQVFSLLWSPRAQFWFLYALFAIFVLATIIFSTLNKRWISLVLLLSIVLYWLTADIDSAHLARFIPENFVYFMFGVWFSSRYNNMLAYSPRRWLLSATAFVIAQYLFHVSWQLNYEDRGVWALLVAVLSINFIINLAHFLSRLHMPIMVFIGNASMVIYLLHIMAGSGTRIVLKSVLHIQSTSIHLIMGCLFGLLLPLLAMIVANKLGMKYLFHAPLSTWLATATKRQQHKPDPK